MKNGWRKLKKNRKISVLSALCLLIIISSCATTPKLDSGSAPNAGPEAGLPDFSFFPPGARLYLRADIGQAKPLLEALSFEGVSSKDASQIMERTNTAMAVLYPESEARRFFLAGWGNYPHLRAGFSMSLNRDWKRVKSETGNRYWYSARNNLGIALGPALAYVTDGDPFTPGQGVDPCPPGFEEFQRPCALAGWLNNPMEAIDRFISTMGIPLQIPAEEFFFGAVRLTEEAGRPADRNWELIFKAKTPGATQARSLITLFALARMFMPASPQIDFSGDSISPQEAASLLFANPPEQDGASIIFRAGPLDEKGIALLFNLFSVYSNKTE